MRHRAKVLVLATAVAVGVATASTVAVTTGSAGDVRAAQTCKGPFVGRSPKDIQTATHNAATVAVKLSHGACKGKLLRVAKIELLLQNPHVKEYRVTLTGGG
jgi:hypothetical protein